ncbi:MAG: hypothetical protein KAG89_12965 [Fulvimarina manganoxydans]|uniref:hypothetical protein n=1 Tax=Fulvimarina manganoxydans TaxID=937218 RepID=UPI0023564BD1|nr:hypothetical protein [Fulvimarina manganoxydans]MCK5933070.1 hypothetical protein [Fulvimarina manganoxydans]
MIRIAKTLGIATLVSGFALAPALAQSDSNNSNSSSSSDMSSSSSNSSANAGMSSEAMVASQSKVLNALKQAGYTDAEVMDAAYLVRAQTPDDETVIMMIDTSGRVIGSSAGGQMGSTQSDGSMQSGSDNNSGSSNNN